MNKEKDILFLCQYFYPEYISSATLPFDTAEALSKAGFSVGALSGYPKEYNLNAEVPLKEIHKNIEIKRLKYIQLKRSNFIGRLINYFSFTFFVALRFKEFRNYKAVIVYSNPPVLPLIAALAQRIYKVKMIFVSYDVYPEMAYITNTIRENSLISKIMTFVNKIVFKHVNKVVALSNDMKAYLLKHRSNLSVDQINVIPNWYEDKGTPDTKESIRNHQLYSIKRDGKFVVSYFGNMGICQDLETLIEAIRNFKGNSKIQFLFAGHGNKMNLLKQIIKDEKLENVLVFDFLHGQDYQDALNISDCFVVSLAEGLTGLAVPSKTYSYMMAGKPVISIMDTDSDIARDLTNNNAGYAIEVGESEQLINAIKELQGDTNKLIKMGGNCRRIFLEKYNKELCTEKYVKMMQTILEDY
jgi:glycosyltransferase involved in cell wall biosynthesis